MQPGYGEQRVGAVEVPAGYRSGCDSPLVGIGLSQLTHSSEILMTVDISQAQSTHLKDNICLYLVV